MARRPALTRELIVEAAVRVADAGGLAAVTMRNVGREVGVEAMSLYHHVATKDVLLDHLADWAYTRIEVPEPTTPWRRAMAERAASARRTLAAHPWALGLVESRRHPGPALLRHHDAVLGNLRANGFSVVLAAHAFSALDSYVYGFVLTELNLPFEGTETAEEFASGLSDLLDPERYPHLVEMIAEQVTGRSYAYGDEFTYGLELILDGLERHRRAERRAR